MLLTRNKNNPFPFLSKTCKCCIAMFQEKVFCTFGLNPPILVRIWLGNLLKKITDITNEISR